MCSTNEEISTYMRGVAEVATGITKFEFLGQSVEEREIAYLIIDVTGVDLHALLPKFATF